MIPSPLALAYFLALVTGSVISIIFGRRSERLIMGAIFAEWALTYPTWALATYLGYGAPVLPYLCADALVALCIIEFMLAREWQVIVARLAVLHVVVHMAMFIHVYVLGMPATNRPYADILTLLGYCEIGVTIWASTHHEWRARFDAEVARHRYRALLPRLSAFHRDKAGRGHRAA